MMSVMVCYLSRNMNEEKLIPSCECSSLLGEKMNKIILYKKNQRQKIHKNVFKQPLFSSLGVVFCIYMFN